MKTVKFKFTLGQWVFDLFKNKGLISMLALDYGGKMYYVKFSTHSEWHYEYDLKGNHVEL